VFALVQKESLNSKNALEWVSQKLISAVLVLYAVSVMDGHSIMLEKNGIMYKMTLVIKTLTSVQQKTKTQGLADSLKRLHNSPLDSTGLLKGEVKLYQT